MTYLNIAKTLVRLPTTVAWRDAWDQGRLLVCHDGRVITERAPDFSEFEYYPSNEDFRATDWNLRGRAGEA